jgi:rhodanese-related sulfurtransferase
MKPIAQLAVILVLAFAAAGTTYWLKGPPVRSYFCDPATLKADEVCLAQVSPNTNILWVDARSRTDWQKSGLPGSVLWNLDPSEDMQAFEAEIAARIIDVPRVIVYCGDENCGLSHQIAARIRQLQLGADVSVLRGGWRALNDAGLTRH